MDPFILNSEMNSARYCFWCKTRINDFPPPPRRADATIHAGKETAYKQACKLKFRLRDFTSCLCSAAAPAVCFKGRVAGEDAIETGNEFSQLKFSFTRLSIRNTLSFLCYLKKIRNTS